MIEPYNLNNDTNELNLMLGSMMKNTFFLVIFLAVLIIISLITWLIRSQNKVRKSFKIWIEKFYTNVNS